jgi:hypothetical protein
MRLIQLDPDGTEESALDFHPAITIVAGLGPVGRERIVQAVRALPRGADPGCPGLIEAHGVLLDLTEDNLKMLDLRSEIDVVVHGDDIPQAGSPLARSAGSSARQSIEQFLSSTPAGVHPQLDEARRAQRDAQEAKEVLREAAERSRRDQREALARREQAGAAVENALWARRAASGDEPDDDRDARAAVVQSELAARRLDLESAIKELDARLDRIDRALDELSSIDTRPVQVLLDALRNPAPVEYVPSDRAQELASEFVQLQDAVAGLEARLEQEGRGPASAMQRLEDARVELQAAEQGMAKPELSPEDVAELEAVHEEVLEAERRATGAFGRRNRKRLDEALAREQAVLDRVGYPTWSAYIMGAGLLAIDPVAEQRLERARLEVEAAEANWAQITAAIEAHPEHRALLDQLEAVYLEAFDLLDGEEPDDLEQALHNLKVPKAEVTTEELVDALAYQLELVGLDLGENPGVDRSIVVAEAFLEETAGITDRIAELHTEREAAERERALTGAELASLPDVVPVPETDEAVDGAELDESPIEPREVTDEEFAELERQLALVTEEEQDAAETVEAREALVDAATQVEAVASSRLIRIASELAEQEAANNPSSEPAVEAASADDDVSEAGQEAIEFYLMSRLAAHRNLSFAGSVPMLLDDALVRPDPEETRKLLGKLERMAEAVQIIYLSDDRAASEWAVTTGFERVALVEAPPGFAG